MSSIFYYNDADFRLSHTLQKKPRAGSFRMHTHDKTEIFYFVRGKGIFHIEGSEYLLEGGDIIILHPSESHYIEIDCNYPYERKVLNFNTDFFKGIDKDGVLLRPLIDRESGKLNQYKSYEFRNDNYISYWNNMMSPDGDVRTNIISNILPLLNEIYCAYSSRNANADSSLDTMEYRIISYINKNLSNKISLNDICSKYYISKPQLCRIFKKSTGSTVWQYITIKRLVKARYLILSGENPTHVYTLCGFNDYSAFYRAYVKNFGCSPKAETRNLHQ